MKNQNHHWLYGILFLSGVAGLGYEIVWMKMLSYGLIRSASGTATLGAFGSGQSTTAGGL